MKQQYTSQLKKYLRQSNIVTTFASTDPYDQSEFLEKQDFTDNKAVRDGFIIDSYSFTFILEARARRLKDKGYDYNPFILSGRHQEEFVTYLAKLSAALKESEKRRFDIVAQVMLDKHATAMSFFVSQRNITCIYLDPSIDIRNTCSIYSWKSTCNAFDVSFSSHGYQHSETPLQSDNHSCLPYAESLLHKMHRMSLDELKAAIPNRKDSTQISTCFMKYTQSTEIMTEYMHLKPLALFGLSKKYTYVELKQKQFREIASSSSYAFGIEQVHSKTQNRGLDFLRESRLQKAVDLIDSISDEEAQNILRSRLNPPFHNH